MVLRAVKMNKKYISFLRARASVCVCVCVTAQWRIQDFRIFWKNSIQMKKLDRERGRVSLALPWIRQYRVQMFQIFYSVDRVDRRGGFSFGILDHNKILDVLLGLFVSVCLSVCLFLTYLRHVRHDEVSSGWFNRLQSSVSKERHEGVALLGVLFTL